MGSGDSLSTIDALLDVAPSAFATAQDQYLVAVKQNYDNNGNLRGPLSLADIVSQHTAEWSNRIDDLVRGLQQRTRGQVRIGTHDTPEDAPQAALNWDAANTRVRLRNAANTGWRDLQLGNLFFSGGPRLITRNGTPEGNEIAGLASLCLDYSAGVVYVKTTASGNTGWVSLVVSSGLNVLHRSVIDVDVDNTTTETDLANYTVPAGTLDVDGRKVVIEQRGDILNVGAARSLTLRIYIDGSITWADSLPLSNIDDRRPFYLRTELIRTDSGEQALYARLDLGGLNGASPDTGTGGSTAAAGQTFTMLAAQTLGDETGSINMRVSVEHSAATSNLRTRQQSLQVSTE